MDWRQVTIIGAGLLGGSIGLAMKAQGMSACRVAWARRQEVVDLCLSLDAFDEATTDIDQAVSGSDLVILCVPVSLMEPLARRALSSLAPGAVLTDVGSVKTEVVAALEPLLAEVSATFVGSHPMAGSEQVGIEAAAADLFLQRVCAVTPTERVTEETLKRVEGFWRDLGMEVLRMSPERHDGVVARCSHLPHIVASQLAAAVLRVPDDALMTTMAGTGFRDTSRLASGSPEMWRDIAQSNRKAILLELDAFEKELHAFREILSSGDIERLEAYFRRSKVARDTWMENEDGAT